MAESVDGVKHNFANQQVRGNIMQGEGQVQHNNAGGHAAVNATFHLAAAQPAQHGADGRNSPPVEAEVKHMRQEKGIHLLKRLKELFRDGRGRTESDRTRSYDVYNEALSNHNAALGYDRQTKIHQLYIGDELIPDPGVLKEITKMMNSLELRATVNPPVIDKGKSISKSVNKSSAMDNDEGSSLKACSDPNERKDLEGKGEAEEVSIANIDNPVSYTPPIAFLYGSSSQPSKKSNAPVHAADYTPPLHILYNADSSNSSPSLAMAIPMRPASPGQEMLKQKALEGDLNAQNDLGDCYFHGKGVAQNYEKAYECFKGAAEGGNAVAQCNLGNCYYRGHGVVKSYALAMYWYTESAKNGNMDAKNNLGNCYKKGRVGAPDLEKAFECFREAAEGGHQDAQFNVGLCYHTGEGVKKDEVQAVFWYQKAADKGNAMGKAYLGFCYEKGQGVAVDEQRALQLYEEATQTGNAFGQDRLEKLKSRQKTSKTKSARA